MHDTDVEMKEATTVPVPEPPAASPDPQAKPEEPTEDPTVGSMVKEFFLGSPKLSIMYIAILPAFIGSSAGWGGGPNFVFSFIALIPLAAILGDLTEDLALRTNDAIGALINVTFGNATELIISIAALRSKQYVLIKQSLAGSVLGNMLLVLGTSLLWGGLKNPAVKFNPQAAQTYMATLILSSFAFLVPTGFHTLNTKSEDPHYALRVSQEISLLMMAIYGAYIYFQLRTHKSMFEGVDDGEDDDEEEQPKYTTAFGVVALAIVAVLISLLSDILVDSVQGAAEELKISQHFIGLVLVPIVGNVAEHASAIMMAAKGKLDISLGVALGSSIQIAMFAMPLTVTISWAFGFSLDMVFTPFTAGCLFVTVLLTYAVVSSGSATWLSGGKLMCAYLILVIAFLNTPNDEVV